MIDNKESKLFVSTNDSTKYDHSQLDFETFLYACRDINYCVDFLDVANYIKELDNRMSFIYIDGLIKQDKFILKELYNISKYSNDKIIAKYYDGRHANVMLFIRSSDNKIERIRIDDTDMPIDNESDGNKFNGQHICAGIYVISRIHGLDQKSTWGDWKRGANSRSHMTTAMFFKGGAIVSLLIVICIVVIVVCVVIYVHDHCWFKSTKMITNEQK